MKHFFKAAINWTFSQNQEPSGRKFYKNTVCFDTIPKNLYPKLIKLLKN